MVALAGWCITPTNPPMEKFPRLMERIIPFTTAGQLALEIWRISLDESFIGDKSFIFNRLKYCMLGDSGIRRGIQLN